MGSSERTVGRPSSWPELDAVVDAHMTEVATCRDLRRLEQFQIYAARLSMAVSDRQIHLYEEREAECRRLNAALETLKRDSLEARRALVEVEGSNVTVRVKTSNTEEGQ